MRRSNWPVTPYAIRPAGPPDRCFYCDSALGYEHALGCVVRSRTVVIQTIVTHTIDVPEDWDTQSIEFTEGSSCSNNLIRDLGSLVDRLDKREEGVPCTCDMVKIEYVREATPEDEARSELYVDKLET